MLVGGPYDIIHELLLSTLSAQGSPAAAGARWAGAGPLRAPAPDRGV